MSLIHVCSKRFERLSYTQCLQFFLLVSIRYCHSLNQYSQTYSSYMGISRHRAVLKYLSFFFYSSHSISIRDSGILLFTLGDVVPQTESSTLDDKGCSLSNESRADCRRFTFTLLVLTCSFALCNILQCCRRPWPKLRVHTNA